MTFPSKGRPPAVRNQFLTTLSSIKSDGASSSVLAVQTAINQCAVDVSIVREDPVNRALFCEAMEAVSFCDGPLRDAARDAVSVLVDCIDESSIGDADDDKLNRTATASALGALWNMSFTNSDSQPATSNQSTIDLITSTKKAMVMFPTDSAVQSNALGVLVNIATDRQGQRQLVNLGCIDAVVAAVKLHKSVDSIVENASQLLSMIGSRKDLRSQIPTGYYKAVAEIALKSSDGSVRRWGNWLQGLLPI